MSSGRGWQVRSGEYGGTCPLERLPLERREGPSHAEMVFGTDWAGGTREKRYMSIIGSMELLMHEIHVRNQGYTSCIYT